MLKSRCLHPLEARRKLMKEADCRAPYEGDRWVGLGESNENVVQSVEGKFKQFEIQGGSLRREVERIRGRVRKRSEVRRINASL